MNTVLRGEASSMLLKIDDEGSYPELGLSSCPQYCEAQGSDQRKRHPVFRVCT
ncbi:hypothetical protein MKW94_008939, partial [Papaver nudicaule]|nr:hypothetical protein [Papaver nudicaule]